MLPHPTIKCNGLWNEVGCDQGVTSADARAGNASVDRYEFRGRVYQPQRAGASGRGESKKAIGGDHCDL